MVEEQNLAKGLNHLKTQLSNFKFSDVESNIKNDVVSVTCELNKKRYCILLWDDIYKFPMIFVEASEDMYPHMSFGKAEFLGAEWKHLCLNVKDLYIIYQMTIEEKIDCILNQLLKLLSLSEQEIKDEFEKEFEVYWQKTHQLTYESYLGKFEINNEVTLLIPNSTEKNDKVKILGKSYYRRDNKRYRNETGYFIKIQNFSGIYPPCYKPWDKSMIKSIFCSLRYTRFDNQAHNFLKKLHVKGTATIIFELPFNDNLLIGLKIQFSDTKKDKFLEKIKNSNYELQFISVDILNIEHSILRNGDDLLNFNSIAMIGCGSLGSYVYRELLNTNIRKFTLIDGDILSSENLSRHILNEHYIGKKKALGLQFYSYFDKSVEIVPIDEYLTSDNIEKILTGQNNNPDIAIVTVGNEDVQHMINNYIYNSQNNFIPTLFCWLEANGVGAHVLAIVEKNKGCYHCVQEYKRTKDRFKYISDQDVPIFSNGCGGSYTHYGSNALLEATSLILKVVQDFSSGSIKENKIYSLKVLENNPLAKTDYYANQKSRVQICNDIYLKGCKYCGEI